MFLLLVDEQQQQQGYENYNGIKRRQFLMIKKIIMLFCMGVRWLKLNSRRFHCFYQINMCMYHFNQYHDK